MKEFSAQTGGRHTYADDLENLQELALAFTQIFDGCDNFIISGCEISDTQDSISSGYVFINGKIRFFSGTTNIGSWPQYIYEQNQTQNVPYESGGDKVGRNIYGCSISNAIPATKDEITGKTPQAICIYQNGGLLMKDAFIGKYALLLNPATGAQTVNNTISFSKQITCTAPLIAQDSLTIKHGSNKTKLYSDGSSFSIEYLQNTARHRLTLTADGGFTFFVNDNLVAQISAKTITLPGVALCAEKGSFSGLVLSGNNLYQGTANSTSSILVNMIGYNGGNTQYRDLFVGNGKGKKIISVLGEDEIVDISASTTVSAGAMDALTLKASVLQSDNALTSCIAWSDFADTNMARIGFLNNSNQVFYITSGGHNISIIAGNEVNIGPAIRENGVLLSEKYMLARNAQAALKIKADASNVYDMATADNRFASKSGGLSQFIGNTNTKENLRSQIGAASSNDLQSYAKLSECLADMASSYSSKAKILNNIGAQPKLNDTGWLNVTNKEEQPELYVRQIGNLVCIQGIISCTKKGIAFSLPSLISTPARSVSATVSFNNSKCWVCRIAEGTKYADVIYNDGCDDKRIEFSLTYMTE